MILIFLLTLVLLLITFSLKGIRCVEVMLLAPFFIGSVATSVLGINFFEVKDGDVFLAICLFFEWMMLSVLLFAFRVDSVGVLLSAELKSSKYYSCGLWVLFFFIAVVLALYILNELNSLVAQSDISSYFISKRIKAHAGEGVDFTNPLAYRVINFSMAMIIFLFVARGCGYFRVAGYKFKLVLFVLFLFGGMASLMEGNRSTLIVAAISIFIYLFLSRSISLIRISLLFMGFILFFVLAQQIFRLEGDISISGLLVGLQWFVLYAFGSVASVSSFIEGEIDLYWKSYDVLVIKFGMSSLFAKEFFIIESVDVGVMRTNVYGGYAVLYDYMGYYLFLFLFLKILILCFVSVAARYFVFFRGVLVALIASFPLTIYHEYFITCLYYGFNIFLIWLISFLLSAVYGFFHYFIRSATAGRALQEGR